MDFGGELTLNGTKASRVWLVKCRYFRTLWRSIFYDKPRSRDDLTQKHIDRKAFDRNDLAGYVHLKIKFKTTQLSHWKSLISLMEKGLFRKDIIIFSKRREMSSQFFVGKGNGKYKVIHRSEKKNTFNDFISLIFVGQIVFII